MGGDQMRSADFGVRNRHAEKDGGDQMRSAECRIRIAEKGRFSMSPEIVFCTPSKMTVIYAFLIDWKLLVLREIGSYSQL
jgi:hypothetical protein